MPQSGTVETAPASDPEYRPHSEQLRLALARPNDERDVEEIKRRLGPVRREVEGLGKVLGHLVLTLEQVADRVQEGAGRTHVADGTPGPSSVGGNTIDALMLLTDFESN